MQKKTILLIIIALALVIAGGWYFYSKYFSDSGAQTPESQNSDQLAGDGKDTSQAGFSRVGNLTSAIADETQNQWLLVYEESNKPALNSKLIFNDKSICDYGSGDVPCSGVKLNDGDMVKVEGNLSSDNQVVVSRMELIPVHDEGDAARLCAQVITSAKNPATGEVKDFPTPCDVPDSWVPVNESSY